MEEDGRVVRAAGLATVASAAAAAAAGTGRWDKSIMINSQTAELLMTFCAP